MLAVIASRCAEYLDIFNFLWPFAETSSFSAEQEQGEAAVPAGDWYREKPDRVQTKQVVQQNWISKYWLNI